MKVEDEVAGPPLEPCARVNSKDANEGPQELLDGEKTWWSSVN